MADTTTIPGIPDLPEVSMHLHTPAAPAVGVVVSNERCTASKKAAGFVRHVVIDVSSTQIASRFVAGQSFGVIPPGVDAKGKEHKVRLYSIASPSFGEDGKGSHIATTVKRLIDEHHDTGGLHIGVASNYLCSLKPGDTVKVSGPSGKRFVLPTNPSAHDYVFFATGTGIAPFRGMLLDLFRSPSRAPAQSRVTLVMGVPYATELLYDAELRELEASTQGRFRYLTALSRESQETPRGRRTMYVQDRLTGDEALRAKLASERTLVYICGIAGMELGIFQALASELNGDSREQYLSLDADAAASIGSWDRRMIHKQIRPTRRIFMEVY
jgi:ferredoxin--NADP+ reductase